MNRSLKFLPPTIALLLSVSCGPELTYSTRVDVDQKVPPVPQEQSASTTKEEDLASPKDAVLMFNLNKSLITLGTSSSKKSTVPAPSEQVNVCDDPNNFVANRIKQIKGDTYVPSKLEICTFSLTTTIQAASDEKETFVADPSMGTLITAASVDGNPLMLKTIDVNYKNPVVPIIQSAGAGAAAGFVFGPFGAVAGGVAGAVGTWLVQSHSSLFLKVVDFETRAKQLSDEHLCYEDRDYWNKYASTFKQSEIPANLMLPVVLDFQVDSDWKKERDIKNRQQNYSINSCWHILPHAVSTDSSSDEKGPPTKWLFRFHAVDSKTNGVTETQKKVIEKFKKDRLPPTLLEWDQQVDDAGNLIVGESSHRPHQPFFTRNDFFKGTYSKNPADRFPIETAKYFPISACRAVLIEITWWVELLKDNPLSYTVPAFLVADSNYVQPVLLPKGGKIYYSQPCGGYESRTLSTMPTTELVDTLINQAQAVKAAQDAHNAAKAKQ